MAILKKLECTIQIDGQIATEYGQEIDENVISTYIIAESDKPFAFRTDFRKHKHGRLDYEIFTDGLSQFNATRLAPFQNLVTVDGSRKQKPDNRWIKQPFTFGTIQTVDEKDESMETRVNIIQALGCLELRIWRAEIIAPSYVVCGSELETAASEKVHEKSLKGRSLGHRTILNKEVPLMTPTAYNTVRLDPTDKPYVHFKFYYRSRVDLQIEGIIPRSPSPPSDEEDHGIGRDKDDVDTMTKEQMREALRRIKEQEKAKKRKPEEDEDSSNGRRIKKEARSVKRTKFVDLTEKHTPKPAEIVDLLDDD